MAKPPRVGMRRRKAGPSTGVLLLFGAIAAIAIVAVVFLLSRPGAARAWELRAEDFHAVAFSPTDANVVFFGHHNGIMKSVDGGRTWTDLVQRRGFDAMALAVPMAMPQVVYMAGHNVFYVSRDGGSNWQTVATDLPGSDIHGFTISPDNPSRLFAFVVGYGLYNSEDGGAHWKQLSRDLPTDITSLASAGGSPEILFASSASSGLLRSEDGGVGWRPAADGGWTWKSPVLSVVVSPEDRTTVFAGTADGLYRSSNGGRTWQRLTYPGRNAVSVAVSADGLSVLAVEFVEQGLGKVHRSDDRGATWDTKQ